MKHFLLLIIVLTVSVTIADAQEEKIKEIRRLYYEASALTDKQNKDDSPKELYSLTVNRVLPGIGPQEKNINFFYKTEQDDEGQETHRLVKVHNSYTIGPLYRVYEEYLFENDKLIFYFERVTGDECGEMRMYFSGDRLIDMSTKQIEGCKEESQMYAKNQKELGENYIEKIAYTQKQAKHLLSAFKSLQSFNN